MRKIFIDCGAHTGRVTDSFIKEIDTAIDYEMFSIEGNPKFKDAYDDKDYTSTFINKVVWTHDNGIVFKIDESDAAYGSSAILTKKTGKLNAGEFMPSLNLSEFINSNFEDEDFIVLKVDIEGAEYDVLPHLAETGAIDKVDVLLLDVHTNRKLGMNNDEFLEKEKRMDSVIDSCAFKVYLEPNFWGDNNFFQEKKDIFK